MSLIYKIYNIYDHIFSNKIEKDIYEILKNKNIYNLTIFDVGCYTGSFSKRLYNLLNKKFATKFFLFDPNPNVEKQLINHEFNYKFFHYAISNETKLKKFNLNVKNSWAGSSLEDTIKDSKLYNFSRNLVFFNLGKKLFKTIEVQTISLDEFIDTKKIKNIDILKIDVEGAELKVLEGVKENLHKIKIIQIEILAEKVNFNDKFNKINKYLNDHNFIMVKKQRIIEGSVLSTLKIYDTLFVKQDF